jgi:hypothetical protein
MLFKSRVLFEELSETVISFADPGSKTSIYFTVDKAWPEMEEGQQATIYFTASGSWSWNRVLDEIDRGPALTQNSGADDPYTGDPAFDQDGYDPAGYDGEAEAVDGTALGDEAEQDPRRRIPPSPLPAASPPRGPAVSRGSALSAGITGAAIRPGKVYRLQVGAYKVEKNAAGALNRLKDAGFSPNYEPHGQYLRVVLSGVRAADIKSYAERIGRAGFTEVWCREER